MKHLKIYEDFDFDEDDFDFEEENPNESDNVNIIDLFRIIGDYYNMVTWLRENLIGKVVNVYSNERGKIIYHKLKVDSFQSFNLHNNDIYKWIRNGDDNDILGMRSEKNGIVNVHSIYLKDIIKTVSQS